MMYLKAPQVTKIRLTNYSNELMFKEVEQDAKCVVCNRPKLAPEPLYCEFDEWMYARLADPKLIEELKGAEQVELALRVRAVIRRGPERGVYAFESVDGKRVQKCIVDPTGGYHPQMLHNFGDWVLLGVQMSDNDPRAILAAVEQPEPEIAAGALP